MSIYNIGETIEGDRYTLRAFLHTIPTGAIVTARHATVYEKTSPTHFTPLAGNARQQLTINRLAKKKTLTYMLTEQEIAERLDALPDGTVIITEGEHVYQRRKDLWYGTALSWHGSGHLAAQHQHITILWTPTTTQQETA